MMWQDALKDFVRFEESHALEREIALRSVRAGALVSAASAVLFAVLYALRGPIDFVTPNLLAAVVFLLIAAVRWRVAGLPLFAAVTNGLLLLGYQLMLLGGIVNGISTWFLAPILAAIILGMGRLAIYCGAITVTEIAGVVIGVRAGWLPAGRVVLPEADLEMAASMTGVVVLCSLFAFFVLRSRQQLTMTLAARNGALAAALEEARLARNAAIAAAQAKERFFANLSHEIRTPLNGIAGTVELLAHTALSAEQQPLAKALGTSTLNLIELVNAILDHAKIAAGHMNIERAPLQLNQLAQDLVGTFTARADESAIRFEVEVAEGAPAWIEGDGIKIKQIVSNLVSNAIKFTARGSVRVRLQCTSAAAVPAGAHLVVEVIDTGMGIASERIAEIFEPFVQGDASITRAHGGTGLGLTISRQLAELLGGTLKALSSPGKGSVFTLELPVSPVDAPPQEEVPKPLAAASFEGMRVLLAEDNPVNQLVAKDMLETLAAEVGVAGNGADAVKMAASGGYRIILMDLQMPGMDGISAAREIRRHERQTGKAPVPIFAMTGNSRDDYGKACREAGMNGFLTKPIRLREFQSVLARLETGH